jgi:hypothetical protein
VGRGAGAPLPPARPRSPPRPEVEEEEGKGGWRKTQAAGAPWPPALPSPLAAVGVCNRTLIIVKLLAGWRPWFFPLVSGGFSTLNLVSPCGLISFTSRRFRHRL